MVVMKSVVFLLPPSFCRTSGRARSTVFYCKSRYHHLPRTSDLRDGGNQNRVMYCVFGYCQKSYKDGGNKNLAFLITTIFLLETESPARGQAPARAPRGLSAGGTDCQDRTSGHALSSHTFFPRQGYPRKVRAPTCAGFLR